MRGLVKRGVSALLSISLAVVMVHHYVSPYLKADAKNEFIEPVREEIVIEYEPEIVEPEIIEDVQQEVVEEPTEELEIEYPKLYTEEDAITLAKMLWGEDRGPNDLIMRDRVVSGRCKQAAVIWTALNRYDMGYEDTITKVVTAKYQYTGYRESNPVDEGLLELVYDVLNRWNAEKHGETDVGRVLPPDYRYFLGDGTHNHFRNEFKTKETYTWYLPDVYAIEEVKNNE